MRWAAFVVAAIVLPAGTAHAANVVADVDDDVDGDGKADHLSVTADGMLHIQAARTVELKIAGTAAKAKLAVSHAPSGTLIVVELGAEAVIVGGGGGSWRELTRFQIGGVGLDSEYAIEVDATPAGVIRYQSRGDIRRCDGRRAYLFPEGYNAATNQFGAIKPPIDVAAGAATLAAHVDPEPARIAPLVYQAHAASTEPGAGNAGGLSLPRELDDGKIETSWHEDLGSDGKGQFFTFEPRVAGAKAKQIRIVSGNHVSAAALRASNRPKRIAIVTKDASWWVELPDPIREPLGTAYAIDLPDAVAGCVSIVLDKTYGPDNGTTTIAELEVYADGERSGGGDALLALAVAEGRNEKAAGAALARRGAPGVAAIEGELAKRSDAVSRQRLIRALVTVRDPTAVVPLGKAAAEGWVSGVDLVAVIDALGALGGGTTELRALAMRKDLDMPVRLAAVRGLHATTTIGLAALGELAGHGPRELRRGIIDSLDAAPIDALVQLATSAATPAASGDAWRAIVQAGRRDPKRRAAALAAVVAALPTATDYDRRYRLVEGVATLGDAAALQVLATALRALPSDVASAALREVAARAFASAPRAEASDFVLALVTDPDPGVRIAALAAIATTVKSDPSGPWHTSSGPDGIDRIVITALGGDRWPEVRQRAAEALAMRCERTGPAKALEASVTGDPEVAVAGAALAALVDCHAPGIAALLARVWDNPKLALLLRARAVDLAVALGDPSLGPALVARLASWRGAAMQSADALELARHAAPAIGRLAPPAAANALLDALDDSAFPEIVAAAAAGLGFLGPACPAPAKAKLRALATSDEQQISLAASRAFAQCGR